MRRAILAGALAIGGCAWWPAAPLPAYRWAEEMLQVCGGYQRELEGWPGARVLVEGAPDQVFAAARETLLAEGFGLAEDRPDLRCLKTTLQRVDDGEHHLPDAVVSGLPPVTERAVAVLASDRAGKTLLQVWLFPKAGDAYLAGVKEPALAEVPARLAAIIKARIEQPPAPTPSPTPQPPPAARPSPR